MHSFNTPLPTKLSLSVVPDNWKKVQAAFTNDELLDAYEIWKMDDKNQVLDLMRHKLTQNLSKAAGYCEDIINLLDEQKITCYSAYIKPSPPFKFEAAFVVNQQDFLDDRFDIVYDLAHEISSKENASPLAIYFEFIPKMEHLNERRLQGEGYILAYSPDGKKSAP